MSYRIGTAETGGTFYTQAEALAELFNRNRAPTERCVVCESEASIDNANRLGRGDLEFGFMASNWIGRALEGTAPFENRIALRMVAPANVGPIFFVSLAGSGIRAVGDLRGRRIVPGAAGSGMAEHVRTIFSVLGIAFEPVYLGYAEAADALASGRVDALFLPPIPNRMATDLSRRVDLRVVEYGPDEIDKIVSEVGYYRRVTIEPGALRGVGSASRQIGVINVVVTHARVPEEAVYAMAKTIVDHLEELPRKNPLFKGLEDLFVSLRSGDRAAFEFGGVPLHPGAARALKESGWLS
ncbi:MAG TPA: TAXI family TRAP transporter solute-binding subunit [candidate division Zixibacteria bacterium]|nr:TAXI family TRAP transporter solute-binding subunit [candidate division Zixibacteria bacterium]